MRKRRNHTGKVALLFMALIVALAGMGAGFAAWTDEISIRGYITTADVSWETEGGWITLECDEECGETAWALCDPAEPFCYECRGGWGTYFEYQTGSGQLRLPLMAGQSASVGTVTVDTAGGNITVEYRITDSEWQILLSHLYVHAEEPDKCAPGKFGYTSAADNKPPKDGEYDKQISATVHAYRIPLSLVGVEEGETVFVAAHADVVTMCGGGQGTATIVETGTGLIASVYCPQGIGSGTLGFLVHNDGTIPIRLTDVSIDVTPVDDPPGVECTLTTPQVIGRQLEPCNSVPCSIDFAITGEGAYTITVVVDAVQWNMY